MKTQKLTNKKQHKTKKAQKQLTGTNRFHEYYQNYYVPYSYSHYHQFSSPRKLAYSFTSTNINSSPNLYEGCRHILYPKGFHELVNFPNDYLDYEPQFQGYQPCSTERMETLSCNDNRPKSSWFETDICYKTQPKIEKQVQTDQTTPKTNKNKQAQTDPHKKKQKEAQTQRTKTSNQGSSTQNLIYIPHQSIQQNTKQMTKKQNNKYQQPQQPNSRGKKQQNKGDQVQQQQNKPLKKYQNDTHIDKIKQIQSVRGGANSQKILNEQLIAIDSKQSMRANSSQQKQMDLLNILNNPPQTTNTNGKQHLRDIFVNVKQKKTFSEAILDELLEKDQGLFEDEENMEENEKFKRFQEEIYKKFEEKDHVKEEINEVSKNKKNEQKTDERAKKQQEKAQKKEKEVKEQKTINNHEIIQNSDHQYYGYSKNHDQRKDGHSDKGEKHPNQIASTHKYIRHDLYPPLQQNGKHNNKYSEGRQLNKQSTISMIVNKNEERNHCLTESWVQTSQKNAKTNKNYHAQTENSPNNMILEQLAKNLLDDRDFRKRIDEKTDQFNKIDVKYEDDKLIKLDQLINSKDSYVRYSKQFIEKLNRVIANSKQKEPLRLLNEQEPPKYASNYSQMIQQPRIQTIEAFRRPNIFPVQHIQPPPPPQQNRIFFSMPINRPIIIPNSQQYPPQFYPQLAPPPPQIITKQIPFSRTPIRK